MDKKDSKNLNITIKNDAEKEGVILSFSSMLKNIKRFFALWLVIAIIAGFASIGIGAIRTFVFKSPIKALVSFTYSGIEKGLDPSGKKFDPYDIINPTVLQRALTEYEFEMEGLDSIRKSINIEGVIPEDAMDRITAYKNVYETASTGNLAAAEAMLNVSYYPTQFKIYFDYGETDLSRSDSIKVLNGVLECYRDYFYEIYGYNQALGTSIPAVNYSTYDYNEQIDIFDDTLTTIEKYVKNLSNEDTNLFRSTETGYTFNDLYRAAQTIKDIDFDRISSYITVNNITKDKEAAIAYYNYKIDNLSRSTTSLSESLKTIEDSITKYEKDTILIFGNGTDGNDTSYSQASEEYDKLIQQRVSTSSNLAETKQRIKFYEARRDALQNNKAGTSAMAEKVDGELSVLGDKVKDLVSLTEKTANEYFQNIQYKHAYNILVPPSASVGTSIVAIIKNAVLPCLVIEALIVFIFFMLVVLKSFKLSSDTSSVSKNNSSDSEDADLEDVIDEIVNAAEDSPSDEKKKSKKK